MAIAEHSSSGARNETRFSDRRGELWVRRVRHRLWTFLRCAVESESGKEPHVITNLVTTSRWIFPIRPRGSVSGCGARPRDALSFFDSLGLLRPPSFLCSIRN